MHMMYDEVLHYLHIVRGKHRGFANKAGRSILDDMMLPQKPRLGIKLRLISPHSCLQFRIRGREALSAFPFPIASLVGSV